MKPFFVIILFFQLIGFTCAQDTKITIGPRSLAMANSLLTLENSISVFNFPASGSSIQTTEVYSGYRNYYNLKELQLIYAGFFYSHQAFGAGVNMLRFGDELYNTNRISLLLSHRISSFSLGLKIRRDELTISELEAQQAYSLDVSGIYHLGTDFIIGMSATNMSQSGFKRDILLPTLLTLAANYKITEGIMVVTELEQEIGRTSEIRLGCEISPANWLAIQSGIKPIDKTWSAGISFLTAGFSIQYGLQNSLRIGTINELALLYFFSSSK